MSALVPDHSGNPDVVTFAAKSASVLQSDIAVARVLLVQWHENPDEDRQQRSRRTAEGYG